MKGMDRRQFLQLAGLGGVVFASGLGSLAWAADKRAPAEDFFFVQLSDTHIGFSGPAANPDPAGTLPKAVQAVNSLSRQPDFLVFTGDLSHNTEDDKERRQRLGQFKQMAAQLKVKDVKFLAGEHDASLDNGQAFKEF